jgi:hypothetical protein
MIDKIKQSGVQDIRTLRNLRQLALKNWPLFIERPRNNVLRPFTFQGGVNAFDEFARPASSAATP